jgi:hypothetical protein
MPTLYDANVEAGSKFLGLNYPLDYGSRGGGIGHFSSFRPDRHSGEFFERALKGKLP